MNPLQKLSIQTFDRPLFPTPWRNFKYYDQQTPTIQINQTDRVQHMTNQIDRIKPRYSKSLIRQRNIQKDDKQLPLFDVKPMERELLNGSRLKFNKDLSMDLHLNIDSKLILPTITESVRVGSISINRDLALPKFLDKPRHRSVGLKKLPDHSIRKFSHVDDLVERVRLQQVDILKKYQVKNFSKDIQNKLKDELFMILKQFQ